MQIVSLYVHGGTIMSGRNPIDNTYLNVLILFFENFILIVV